MEMTGTDAENFLEYILVADLANLKSGSGQLYVIARLQIY